MTIVEKAAYLKGLAEGFGMDAETRDGKLWTVLNDLLSDMAHEIEDLQATSLDYADALDEISEDLSYLEEITCDLDTPEDFVDYDDEEYDDEASPCSGDCSSCSGCGGDGEEAEDYLREDDEELQYDGVMYDVTCPTCGEEISFDEETLLKGSINCPNCGEKLEFDTEEE